MSNIVHFLYFKISNRVIIIVKDGTNTHKGDEAIEKLVCTLRHNKNKTHSISIIKHQNPQSKRIHNNNIILIL